MNIAERCFVAVIGAMNAIATLWIFLLMIGINADVIGRELFSAPIRGVPELVSLSIVGIVFLELPHALWVGRITRNDALRKRLIAARPALARGLERLFSLIGIALFVLVAAASATHLQKGLRVDEYVGALGDFTAPTWPVRAMIVLGCIASAICYALRGVRGRL